MRVLFISSTHITESQNGASIYDHNFAKWLQSKGHEVKVMPITLLNPRDGEFDGVPFYQYSHRHELIDWAETIITPPGKVRQKYPGKQLIFVQHNQNKEPYHMEDDRVIYCAHHVQRRIDYQCADWRVLWPFNRYAGCEPLPINPAGKVTLVNCNLNKGGRFLGHLAKQLPDVQFLGIKGGYGPQIEHKLPNIEYRQGGLDLRAMLKDTSLLIMPSEKEGLPTLALEAYSLGIPVLMADIPAAHELGANIGTWRAFDTHIKAVLSCLSKERENSLSLAVQHAATHAQQLSELECWF